jgi:hypothetical protein
MAQREKSSLKNLILTPLFFVRFAPQWSYCPTAKTNRLKHKQILYHKEKAYLWQMKELLEWATLR